MALTTQKSAASLVQRTLNRQAAVTRLKFKFNKNQVEQILISYVRNGNSGPYTELLKVLHDYPLNDENYRILFEDSLSCVLLLGRDLSQYVELVCSVEWANRSEELVELFSEFVLSLVTAHSYHCSRVITCLMKCFKGKYCEIFDDT